jgi:hypothetical protein
VKLAIFIFCFFAGQPQTCCGQAASFFSKGVLFTLTSSFLAELVLDS